MTHTKRRKKKHRRQRKSQVQREALWTLFKSLAGRPPKREQITELSNRLKLKEQQIYKWFWDTKKKVDEDEQYALEVGQDAALVFDEQGSQTVKHWRQSRECAGYEGHNGLGDPLTPLQIKTAIKIHDLAKDKEEDYERLAKDLNLEITDEIEMLLNEDSPIGSR